VSFQNPSNPANPVQLPGGNNSIYTVAANQIIIYVGGSSMGVNDLGLGGSGSWSASGSSAFLQNVRTRGQTGVDSDTDYSLWGGFISFNKDYANWFFDSTLATSNDISGSDFYSVVVHELAHVLGFGIADSWDHWVTGTTFDGPNTSPTALTSDKAHWAQGTTSTINGVGSFEAALDPSLTNGTRKELTDLDWNGLRDVGWQVAAVPEAETWAMLLAGLGLVGAVARRRRG
jgi:MYXO-CTERM domain-containing protein